MRNHDEFREELLRRKHEFDTRRHRRNTSLTRALCAALCICLMFSFAMKPTSVNAENLLDGYTPRPVHERAPDEAFTSAQVDFALKLLQGSYEGENTLVSPLSATMALSMLANGAEGDTLSQIESVLCGGIPIETWNEYQKYYVNSLPSTAKATLHQANSIWYASDPNLSLHPAFLQTITDYYDAELYTAPFSDVTVEEINNWISHHTNGLIEDALNELSGVMCFINALVFDGKWATPYDRGNILDRPFHNADGTTAMVDMMFSQEGTYLQSDTATGFSKAYAGGTYRFVAILPNEDLTLTEYLENLTAEELTQLLNGGKQGTVEAGLPQFEYEYSVELKDVLREMGITDAFDPGRANLSGMGRDLFVDSVLQKTRIIVDAEGTKAAATTIGGVATTAAPLRTQTVILDRPFLYMIVDTQTNLPIFLGTVTDLG